VAVAVAVAVAVWMAAAVALVATTPSPIGNNMGGASGECDGKLVAPLGEDVGKNGRAARGEMADADDEAADIEPGVVVVTAAAAVVAVAVVDMPVTLGFVSATDDCGMNDRHSDGNPVKALSVSSHSTCTNRLTSMGREITPCSATGCQDSGSPCGSWKRRARLEFMSIGVRGTSDETTVKTRTVCRTSVLFLSLESEQCITRYTDSKSDQVENL
jgi:hypothetical protein